MPRCIIFTNGTLPNLDSARRILRPDDFILCADGGTHHALALGLIPNVILGDFDSITDEERQRVMADGVQIFQYPSDKNETDLELALNYAMDNSYREIVIVAALGNRLDQSLGNLALLTDPRFSTCDLRLDDGVEQAFFCHGQTELHGRRGDIVSLIPWGRDVTSVRTEGLKWPLSDETLSPHKTRGISNEMLGEIARVQIQSGLLLVLHRRQPTTN